VCVCVCVGAPAASGCGAGLVVFPRGAIVQHPVVPRLLLLWWRRRRVCRMVLPRQVVRVHRPRRLHRVRVVLVVVRLLVLILIVAQRLRGGCIVVSLGKAMVALAALRLHQRAGCGDPRVVLFQHSPPHPTQQYSAEQPSTNFRFRPGNAESTTQGYMHTRFLPDPIH